VQQYNWSGDFRLEIAKPEHKKPGSSVYVTRYRGPIEKLREEFAGKDVVVRKLMPEECFRLMGFRDFKIHKDLIGQDQVLYRQAGNSIAVPVLKALICEINKQVFERR
jgi:site-specific DNA-cytosine methylase